MTSQTADLAPHVPDEVIRHGTQAGLLTDQYPAAAPHCAAQAVAQPMITASSSVPDTRRMKTAQWFPLNRQFLAE
jgi:hypothetical protein